MSVKNKENLYDNNFYKVSVVKVVDGDTVLADVDFGCHVRILMKLRLAEINTPEVTGSESESGKKSAEYLTRRLVEAESVCVQLRKPDKYGRYLAIIYAGKININEELVKEGYAKPYK